MIRRINQDAFKTMKAASNGVLMWFLNLVEEEARACKKPYCNRINSRTWVFQGRAWYIFLDCHRRRLYNFASTKPFFIPRSFPKISLHLPRLTARSYLTPRGSFSYRRCCWATVAAQHTRPSISSSAPTCPNPVIHVLKVSQSMQALTPTSLQETSV